MLAAAARAVCGARSPFRPVTRPASVEPASPSTGHPPGKRGARYPSGGCMGSTDALRSRRQRAKPGSAALRSASPPGSGNTRVTPLADAGTVYLTARDLDRGRDAVEQLRSRPVFYQLDVQCSAEVDAAARHRHARRRSRTARPPRALANRPPAGTPRRGGAFCPVSRIMRYGSSWIGRRTN